MLTPEQVQQYRQKYGVGGTQQSTATPNQEPQTSFLGGIKQDFASRVDKAADAQVSALQGQQSDKSAALQTIGQGGGFLGDIFARGISAITPEPVKNVLKQGVQKLAGTEKVQDSAKAYEDWKTAHPEAAANLEAIGNLTNIIPFATGATKGIQATTKAALVGTGKALEGAADAVSVGGRAIKGSGAALYRGAITPNVKEAEKILNQRANSPFLTRVSDTLKGNTVTPPITRAQTALEKGIYGTETAIGVQAKRQADELWNKEIAPAVKNSDATMTKEELFAPAIARINATTDPTRRQALINALDALTEDFAKFDESFDLTKAQALKRDLAEFTPAKVFRGQEVASEVRMLQADMADAIRQKTYEALADEGIKRKYIDWANLYELQNVGVKAISSGGFQGGSGKLIISLWDIPAVPVRTTAGQVLYRVGNKLEFSAPKNIKTLGQYLQSVGYSKPKEYDIGVEFGAGLSTKDVSGIPVNVRPDIVARKMDKADRNIMVRWLDDPKNANNALAADRLFKELKIDKADSVTKRRFIIDVLDESNL